MKAATIAYSLAGRFAERTDTAIAEGWQGYDGKSRANETREFWALIFCPDEDAADADLDTGIDSSDEIKLCDEAENEQKNEAESSESLVTAEATAAQMTSAIQIMQASALYLQSNDSSTEGDALLPVDTDLTEATNTSWETGITDENVSGITSDTIAGNSPFSELVSDTPSNELDGEDSGFVSSVDDLMYQSPATDAAADVNKADGSGRTSREYGDLRYGSLKTDSSGESAKAVSDDNTSVGSTSVFVGRVLKSLQSRDTGGLNSDTVGENQNKSESTSTNASETANDISNVASGFTSVINEAVSAPDDTEKSSAVKKALDNFVQDFRGIETGESEIHITLEPESLGKLSIFMSQSEKGLYIEIQSDDLDICASLLDQVDSMIGSIQDHGIKIDNFDVRYMDSGTSNYSSGGSGQQSGSYGREQPAHRSPAADATLLDNNSRKYILMLHDYYYYDAEAVGFIEYRI